MANLSYSTGFPQLSKSLRPQLFWLGEGYRRVPTRLFRKRLTETYGELLEAVLLEVGLPHTRLDFVLGAGAEARARKPAYYGSFVERSG